MRALCLAFFRGRVNRVAHRKDGNLEGFHRATAAPHRNIVKGLPETYVLKFCLTGFLIHVASLSNSIARQWSSMKGVPTVALLTAVAMSGVLAHSGTPRMAKDWNASRCTSGGM
jgi:hypothetical protein